MFEAHISKHLFFSVIALTHSRSRSVARRGHIQAFARKTRADCQDHGRLTAEHMSKHSPAPACRDERPKSCAWAKSRLTRKKKKRELFITGIFPARELFYITVLKLIQKNRRRVKLQSLQFYINSKTIKLQRVKSAIIFAAMVLD